MNLRVSLQIRLTLACSIASCERSFSKLKLILTYLQAAMKDERLKDLGILSIERSTTMSLNYDEVIDMFARLKSRKVPF